MTSLISFIRHEAHDYSIRRLLGTSRLFFIHLSLIL
jgi:hypothetical protein